MYVIYVRNVIIPVTKLRIFYGNTCIAFAMENTANQIKMIELFIILT